MARGEYISFPMIVDSVVCGLITATQDIVDRFDIPDEVLELELPGSNRTRHGHERRVYLNDNTEVSVRSTNVKSVVKVYRPDRNRINSGRKVKLPTGFRSKPASLTGPAASAPLAGSARMATFNFPHGSSNYQIARWITVNIPTTKRPNYMILPSGAKRRVATAAAPAQTTGEDDATPETP